MEKMFKEIANRGLLEEWAEILDWLFDDSKFSKDIGWNRGYTGLFAKRIQRFSGFSKDKTFVWKSDTEIQLPGKNTKRTAPYVAFTKGDGIARDFVRHMRNGIAHGLTYLFNQKGALCIEIIDFSDKGKKNQTAYFSIPISFITESFKVYQEIEKSIRNTSEKDRKQRKIEGKRKGDSHD